MVDKAARGGKTVLKHLKTVEILLFLYVFVRISGFLRCLGVFSSAENGCFFGVEGPPYGVSNLH